MSNVIRFWIFNDIKAKNNRKIALSIQKGWRQHTVTELREMYNLILKDRQPDGQIQTNWEGGIKLERLNFAQEFDKFKGAYRILGYNGLVVIEVKRHPAVPPESLSDGTQGLYKPVWLRHWVSGAATWQDGLCECWSWNGVQSRGSSVLCRYAETWCASAS